MTDDLLLHADEEVLWAGSPRLSAAIGAVVGGLVLVSGGVAGAVFLPPEASLFARGLVALLIPVGLAVPVYRVVELRRTRFAVSDAAVYARSGVLSREVRRVGLERVQNSAYTQSITGSLFGYGTVTFESAGGPSATFFRIETPREVRALVDRRAERARDPVPGTIEQWTEVLAEVRELRAAIERRGGVRE
ncbi:PH domain-containing protein [Haloglomus halophilum]|uniref:PH domain-containing protein n=1 Tax=Haloglomus halophilum TaxID=2962672 RepID=UPI0020C98F66|nr:PH domain-containing protein [Haloglomus halophilum]